MTTEHLCLECGGSVVVERRAGRLKRYRGEGGYEIPAWMAIPTCQSCGALWMDSAMVKQLGSVFEMERALQAGLDECVAAGHMTVEVRNGEKFYKLTDAGTRYVETELLPEALRPLADETKEG